MTTLLLELSLTRIFSVVFFYSMAFLAISIALFGLGIGGVFSYVVAGWKAPLFTRLGRLSAVNSFLVLLALGVILLQGNQLSNWDLALIYFTTALPFFISGTVVSLAISETIERVNRVYFFDLLGASVGCLLLVPLLGWFGGPNTVIAAALFFAVAAAMWHGMAGSVMDRAGSVALALGLVALLIYNRQHRIIDVTHSKGQTLANCADRAGREAKVGCEVWTGWNTFSRIALVDHTQKDGRYDIVIDGDAATSVANFDFDHLSGDDRRDLRDHGENLPYIVRRGAKTLVIGPGGGWDVARALASGSHDVTAVEINPIIATTIMREKFRNLSRGLYWRPDVHVSVEDGRSFVRRSAEKYQVVQATLVDTWASTAAGAFALSENNLYTTDAFRDYLSHLTDDGLVAVTRWGLEPPRESLRLISLAMEALGQLGERNPAAHVMVGREGTAAEGWPKDTVLISRSPFTTEDVARVRALIDEAHMTAVYLPGVDIHNQFYDLLHSPNPKEYERHYTFDITPVTDNRPFFFFTVQPRDLWAFLTTASKNTADYKINKAVPLLFGLMGVSLLATTLVLLAPPLVLGTRLPRHKGVRSFLLYFLFVGADSEIRPVSGATRLCAGGGDLLYAGVERPRQLLEPSPAGQARWPVDESAWFGSAAGHRSGADPFVVAFGASLAAARVEGITHGDADRPSGLRHGDAVPNGAGAVGRVAPAFVALGLVAKRRIERARLSRRAGMRHLLGPRADTDYWRPVLSGCVGGGDMHADERESATYTMEQPVFTFRKGTPRI